VVARSCEASWELAFLWFVCVAPLRLGGLRGKKSTPSVGWEIPVKSSWLASKELDGAQARGSIFELSSSPVTIILLSFTVY
jgi:hypothetical protein